jgi:hypothetical protein
MRVPSDPVVTGRMVRMAMVVEGPQHGSTS